MQLQRESDELDHGHVHQHRAGLATRRDPRVLAVCLQTHVFEKEVRHTFQVEKTITEHLGNPLAVERIFFSLSARGTCNDSLVAAFPVARKHTETRS